MPLWAVNGQAGSNPNPFLNFTDVRPGDDYAMLDGTEVLITGSLSVAFARGDGRTDSDQGTSFYLSGCPNGTVVTIQVSPGIPTSANSANQGTLTVASLDATFQGVYDMAPTGGVAAYTDVGRPAFYRAKIKSFVNGDVPILTVKR